MIVFRPIGLNKVYYGSDDDSCANRVNISSNVSSFCGCVEICSSKGDAVTRCCNCC